MQTFQKRYFNDGIIVSKNIKAISGVLHNYQVALKHHSIDEVVQLYTRDGICMPQHAPSFVGIANVRKASGRFSR